MKLANLVLGTLLLAGAGLMPPQTHAASVRGWLSWRGPDQNGTSPETGLPDKIDA